MKVFETFIAMEPVAKARPRVTKTGHAFTPTRTVKAEFRVQEQVAAEWGKAPLESPIALELFVYLARPKAAKKRIFPLSRPDADNYLKLLLDSLNAIMWKDDSLVATAIVHKRYVDDAHPHPGFGLAVYDLSELQTPDVSLPLA